MERSTALLLLLFAGITAPCMQDLAARDLGYREFRAKDGTVIEYRLAAPDEKQQEYPFLLALPPGSQDRSTVDWGWKNLYLEQAEKRGWVVLSPVAPGGRKWFQGGLKYLPQLLREVSREYPPEGGRYHLAGVSNGGLTGFMLAVRHPRLFHSLAVFPGWPRPRDLSKLKRIAGLRVKMWAGENDNPN